LGLLGAHAYSTLWLHVSSLINTFFALGGGQNHYEGQNRKVLHDERSEMAFGVLWVLLQRVENSIWWLRVQVQLKSI
jgi:hypothetical protein